MVGPGEFVGLRLRKVLDGLVDLGEEVQHGIVLGGVVDFEVLGHGVMRVV